MTGAPLKAVATAFHHVPLCGKAVGPVLPRGVHKEVSVLPLFSPFLLFSFSSGLRLDELKSNCSIFISLSYPTACSSLTDDAKAPFDNAFD